MWLHTRAGMNRVHILGRGALGCLFAARLQRVGVPVTMICKDADAPHDVTLKVGQ
jgi:ketopantoate reductase